MLKDFYGYVYIQVRLMHVPHVHLVMASYICHSLMH